MKSLANANVKTMMKIGGNVMKSSNKIVLLSQQ